MKRDLEARAAAGDQKMLCMLTVGTESFGIDTRVIREVLGTRAVHRVPLSPPYIAGAVSYRGNVLTTVSLRAVLGMEQATAESNKCVLVLDGDSHRDDEWEQFGLKVDSVGGVVPVSDDLLRENPPPLSEAYRRLCCGAFRVGERLLVQLDADQLKPERLAEQANATTANWVAEGERAV